MATPIHFYHSDFDFKITKTQKYRQRRKAILKPTEVSPKRDGLWKKTKVLMDEFLINSTIHGLWHLSQKDRHYSERILWIGVLAAAIMGTVYIGQQSLRRYQYFPTVISMEKDYRNWNTTFAMATICPDNKVNESVLRKLSESYKVKDTEIFVRFFTILAGASYDSFHTLPLYNEIRPEDYLEIIKQAKFNFAFTLSNSQDIEQELLLMVTENSLCYAFNTEIGAHFSTENFNKELPTIRRNKNLITGSPLDGEVFLQVMNMNSGYIMFLTGPYDIPDVSVRRFVSELRYYLLLELSALSIISSDKVRSLTPEQRKCRFFDESNLGISSIYSYNLCRMQCRADLGYELCRCVPHFYRKSGGRPTCDAAGLHCLGKHGQYLTNLREPLTNKKIPCDCLPLCNDVYYLVELETYLEWSVATNMKFSMDHYPRMRLKRDVIFGFADLLVSIGGTAGLFLGCSVLSFIEILYFVTVRLLFFFRGLMKGNRPVTYRQ